MKSNKQKIFYGVKQESLSLSLVKLIFVAMIITSIGIALLIGATGYFLSKPKIEPAVVQPTPQLSEEAAEEDTSNWKTYRNEEYGFEIKYPEEVRDEEIRFRSANDFPSLIKHINPFGVVFPYRYYKDTTRIGEDDFIIAIADNPSQLPIRTWIQKYEYCGPPIKPSGEEFTLAERKGIRIKETMTCPPGASSIKDKVYLPKDEKVYALEILATDIWVSPQIEKEFLEKREKIFEQILSTFKFIEPEKTEIDISNWKTYRNEKYGYEIKYPNNWEPTEFFSERNFEIRNKMDPNNTLSIRTPLTAAGSGFIDIEFDEDIFIANEIPAKKKTELLEIGDYKFWRIVIQYRHKEGGVIIYDYPYQAGRKIEYLSLFNQMLSTFKFIEKDETTDWQIYNAPEFSFKYPLDWEIRFDVEDKNEPRFLVLGNKRKNENRADEILINLPSGATKYMLKRDLPGGNIIMTESKNEEVLKVFEGIINTFKIGNYNLDCVNEPENFQAKYSWYNHFKKQIIKGWSLNAVCYNSQLNKVAYLKSKIDWENYKYDPNKSSYGLNQLGVYDIKTDNYEKAPAKNLGFYEDCDTIKEWKKNNEIIYQCGAGDAGFGSSWTYSYNLETKKVTLIEECTIEAGRDPEEICVEK